MLFILEIVFVAVGLNLLINYAIGKPGGQFSPNEIFSSYTVWLSKRRLRVLGMYNQYEEQYLDNLKRAHQKHEFIAVDRDFKKIFYDAAEPFFTWEKAFGMCTVCTGFWVSLLVGLMVTQNISELIEIIVISHVTIRIFNKIL